MQSSEEITCYSGETALPCYDGKLAIFCAMAFFLFHVQKKHLQFVKSSQKNSLTQILKTFDIDL